MKLIIAGSRNLSDKALKDAWESYPAKPQVTQIVSGHARGIDTCGEELAEREGLSVELFPAFWSEFGISAGFIRNKAMANYADALLAVWDGVSRGTKHMIYCMRDQKKLVYIHIAKPIMRLKALK